MDYLPMERCLDCNKPSVNEFNLKILRYAILGGSTIAAGIGGFFALPLLGFTTAGVASSSIAAGWQATIGNVAAGSLFAILQSLGTSVTIQILFGAVGSAIGAGTGALGTLLVHAKVLGFCQCGNPTENNTISLAS